MLAFDPPWSVGDLVLLLKSLSRSRRHSYSTAFPKVDAFIEGYFLPTLGFF